MFHYAVEQSNVAVGQSFLERTALDRVTLDELGVHQVFGISLRAFIPVNALFENTPPETRLEKYNYLDDDHCLLFSLRPDPNVGFSDKDNEAYGFWIKESDLAKQCFDNVVVWREFD